MVTITHALQGGLGRHPTGGGQPAGARRRVVVAGAAGPLGSLVLERLLAAGAHSAVVALVVRPIEVAVQGLQAWPVAWPPRSSPADGGAADSVACRPTAPQDTRADLPQGTDTAVLVFDREGSRHGREAAFLRPEPAHLPALAAWLRAAGVTRLLLVLPHAPGLMPPALRAGLASLDEQATAALGFEQLVLVRPARSAAAGGGPRLSWPARLARALLAQLSWLVPQREQPIRAAKVAELVAALVRGLPAGQTGIRVITPEQLFDWAQPGGGQPWLDAWLHHRPLPGVMVPARRW